MSEQDDASIGHNYRLAQAQKLLDVFEEAHGRPAQTYEELEDWAGSPEGKAALAYHRTPNGTIIP
jgi:hypothetical protein